GSSSRNRDGPRGESEKPRNHEAVESEWPEGGRCLRWSATRPLRTRSRLVTILAEGSSFPAVCTADGRRTQAGTTFLSAPGGWCANPFGISGCGGGAGGRG